MSAEKKGLWQKVIEAPRKLGYLGAYLGGAIWFFNPAVGIVIVTGSAIVTVAGAGVEIIESRRPKAIHDGGH